MLSILTAHFSTLNTQQVQQFSQLEKVYQAWNHKINVISRKDTSHLFEKHFLHALFIARFFPFQAGTQIIDIGTGGGIPGIPLAIFFPTVSFTLVDSIGKKIKVVEAIVESLQLQNVFPICRRVEDLKEKKFDIALSRATAPLKNLVTWSRSCLNPRSTVPNAGLICLKGGDLREEIAETNLLPLMIPLEKNTSLEYYHKKYILFIALNQIF